MCGAWEPNTEGYGDGQPPRELELKATLPRQADVHECIDDAINLETRRATLGAKLFRKLHLLG